MIADMMVTNLDGISGTIVLSKFVGHYIAQRGFPILSVTNDGYVFKNTKEIKDAISNIPFALLPFCKVVMENG